MQRLDDRSRLGQAVARRHDVEGGGDPEDLVAEQGHVWSADHRDRPRMVGLELGGELDAALEVVDVQAEQRHRGLHDFEAFF